MPTVNHTPFITNNAAFTVTLGAAVVVSSNLFLVPVIGLGDATIIDTLRVEWPSGIVQELHNVPVKQKLTIVEPAPSWQSPPMWLALLT